MELTDVKLWYDVLLLLGGVLALLAVLLVPAVRELRLDLRDRRAQRASFRRAFELACDLFDTTQWVQIIVSRTSEGYVAAAIVRNRTNAVCGQVPMSTPDGAIDSLCLALTKRIEQLEDRAEAKSEGWSA